MELQTTDGSLASSRFGTKEMGRFLIPCVSSLYSSIRACPQEDIKLVKGLGSNCFRFSFEWGRLEPGQGKWDESAFQRYSEILDCLDVSASLPPSCLSSPKPWHHEAPV